MIFKLVIFAISIVVVTIYHAPGLRRINCCEKITFIGLGSFCKADAVVCVSRTSLKKESAGAWSDTGADSLVADTNAKGRPVREME